MTGYDPVVPYEDGGARAVPTRSAESLLLAGGFAAQAP